MNRHLQTRYVIFDGQCGFCRRAAQSIRRLNWLKKAQLTDVYDRWTAVKGLFPSLDFDACLRDIHIVKEDGRIDLGFDGYRSLAWVLPLAWPILPLLYLPPVRWLGWKAYRYVADHRHACPLPPPKSG